MGWLPFIDGLRGVAILAVLAFHTGLPGASAGFLGVDLFFVISGFLILGNLFGHLEAGRLSVLCFLVRRALRILPAFFVMMLGVVAAIPFFPLLADEIREIGASGRSAAGFVANSYFLGEVGYFDAAAQRKPLLHLWSLSVEAQFYGAAVVAAVVAFRLAPRMGRSAGRIFLALVSLSAGVSLALWFLSWHFGEGSGFYLAPFRAWQFLLGGLAHHAARRGARVSGASGLGGLCLVAGLAGAMQGSVLASLGTALILFSGAGGDAGPVTRALSLRPLRAVGLISYPWYLWHWPALFFLRTLNFGEPAPWLDAIAVLASFGLSVITHLAVERPVAGLRLRRPEGSGRAGRTALATVAAGLGLLAAAFLALELAPFAAPDIAGPDGPGASQSAHDGPGVVTRAGLRSYEPSGKPATILIYGDSHAEHLIRMAEVLSARGPGIGVVAGPGCAPFLEGENGAPDARQAALCRRFREAAREKSETAEAVVIAAYWRLYIEDGPRGLPADTGDRSAAASTLLREDLLRHRAAGRRVFVVLPLPWFNRTPPDCTRRAPLLGVGPEACSISRAVAERNRLEAVRMIRRAAAGLPGVIPIDPMSVFCDRDLCLPFINGRIAFRDKHHLNRIGSEALAGLFARAFAGAGFIAE